MNAQAENKHLNSKSDSPSARIGPGSVVKLKSGGPDMSVRKIEDNGDASCIWAAEDGYESAMLPLCVLSLIQ
jgi:uncharacterized protein YodC (DUF2158 family)